METNDVKNNTYVAKVKYLFWNSLEDIKRKYLPALFMNKIFLVLFLIEHKIVHN